MNAGKANVSVIIGAWRGSVNTVRSPSFFLCPSFGNHCGKRGDKHTNELEECQRFNFVLLLTLILFRLCKLCSVKQILQKTKILYLLGNSQLQMLVSSQCP